MLKQVPPVPRSRLSSVSDEHYSRRQSQVIPAPADTSTEGGEDMLISPAVGVYK
jgi:hypothetical protein